jgi:asparagine synthase (glutamine-hydrolysing)
MCGLVGMFDLRGRRTVDAALLGRMNQRLAHRGPDGDGVHCGPGYGLGHRRLAIIDLRGGRQPLFNEDGSVAVVFNGEIYNFAELVPQLEERGHRFRTRSDTEVIVHAWEEWGEACVERFRGMFAFALVDEKAETLFLARDRLGKKPLYYTLLPDGLVLFASELKALLVHPGVQRRLDPQAVEEYFALGYVPDPRCIYRGIAKLPAGHALKVRRGSAGLEPRAYWNIAFAAAGEGEATDEASLCEALIEELRTAVRLRLIAEVPLGAFLSGGVDSGAVVALMADGSHQPVKTFTVSFGETEFDESEQAAEVAVRYRTDHNVSQADLASLPGPDRVASIYDEPFADVSALPTYRICAAARAHVAVALSGDGGDELFAGYRRYRWHGLQERARAVAPQWLRGPLFGTLARLYPKLDWAPRPLRAKTTFAELAASTVDGYFHNVCLAKDGLRQRLYGPRLRADLQGYSAVEVIDGHLRQSGTDDPLAQAQYVDIKTYLPGDILTKVDRASMASSLEVRAPLLDHRFAEWAARLPAGAKLRDGRGKHIFKRALEPYLGGSAVRRPKRGFTVPLAAWLRGPLRAQVIRALKGPMLRESELFDLAFIERLCERHMNGRGDHGQVLWSLLCFEAFLRQGHERGLRH